MKRLLCVLLAMLLIFGSGCAKENGSSNTPDTAEKIEYIDSYLIEKGRTDYVIMMPDEPASYENTAKNELVTFFKEATGLNINVKFESEITYNENSKVISLGKTYVAKEKGIIPTYAQVGEQGYVIKTIDKSIFITSYAPYGTLCGVYKLLEKEFDYDFYTTDSYTINTVKKDVKVRKYDMLVEPEIAQYTFNYGYVINDTDTANRLMSTKKDTALMYLNGYPSVHNTLAFLPKETYQADHEEWYSPDGSEICFTARGNQEEFEAMTTALTESIKKEFKAGNSATILQIGQQDGGKNCSCDNCRSVEQEYGATSAKGIIWCNRVLEKVYAWFETEEGRAYKREFYIVLLAYEKTVDAPVHLENGKWVLNNGLTINDHFGVMHAPIKFDYSTPKNDKNKDEYVIFEQWDVASNVFTFYGYDTNYYNFMVPFNTFDAKKDILQALASVKCRYITDLGHYNEAGISGGYSMLKNYLWSKMRWDTEIDVNYYTEKFFYGVYGEEVGAIMLETFYDYRAYWKNVENRYDKGEITRKINQIQGQQIYSDIWEKGYVENWWNKFNKAFDLVEPLKDTDLKEYNRLAKLISAERVAASYLLIRLYEDYYSATDLFDMKMQFKNDTIRTGLTRVNELAGQTIDSLLTGWGV